ncbi:AraC family transcriptional regulator [Polluticaenibacter yanchengensis]|uniref:Helix-turn-helix transcriptional regulator n=1 Tax=Polluticaenibacter yanchengensis TaxID=3014562 RepID=A0ABT4UK57_9BACT|nr:helix-turn-helix transcriptional regulator [Chitinophagaceae bacterium LY-5]
MRKLNKGNYSGNVHQLIEHSGLITSQTTYTGNYNIDFHYHENPHLTFILQGGNLEYKSNQNAIKDTGTVLFYYSGELHKTLPTITSTKNLNIEIDQNFLHQYSLKENDLESAVETNQYSRFFMLKIHSELQLNDPITETATHSLMLSFLKGFKAYDYNSIEWCNKLKEILNDEWDTNHSLEDLSLKLGVHPVTISKYFHKYFGTTLGEYIRMLRINKSLYLIKNTSLSLTEIALLCGFADQSHFIKVFKNHTGLKPKYFQKL